MSGSINKAPNAGIANDKMDSPTASDVTVIPSLFELGAIKCRVRRLVRCRVHVLAIIDWRHWKALPCFTNDEKGCCSLEGFLNVENPWDDEIAIAEVIAFNIQRRLGANNLGFDMVGSIGDPSQKSVGDTSAKKKKICGVSYDPGSRRLRQPPP